MKNSNSIPPIPFNDLSRRYKKHSLEIDKIAQRILSSGQYILGPENVVLEKELASFFSAQDVVTTGSGTDSLVLALRALDIGHGDEVITVANTCTPTIAAIRTVGATPVFADIEEDALTMNPDDIERCITAKTKAILPVHLYGFPSDMHSITTIAHRHDLRVIEDCAQSIGATINDTHTGMFGDAGCLSFYPTKNLGAYGDAGAVVSKNTNILSRIRRLRVYGEQERNVSIEEGINSRMDELQAGLLTWGMKHLSKGTKRRSDIAKRYIGNITNPDVNLPISSEGERKRVWHLFVVRVLDRESFTKYLFENNIGFSIHYPRPVYMQKAYAFLNESGKLLPITENATAQVVSLPLFPELTDKEVDQVIKIVNSYNCNQTQ
jgi:dTDP-4-amino-4,6-dideoxygalactose transaminase